MVRMASYCGRLCLESLKSAFGEFKHRLCSIYGNGQSIPVLASGKG